VHCAVLKMMQLLLIMLTFAGAADSLLPGESASQKKAREDRKEFDPEWRHIQACSKAAQALHQVTDVATGGITVISRAITGKCSGHQCTGCREFGDVIRASHACADIPSGSSCRTIMIMRMACDCGTALALLGSNWYTHCAEGVLLRWAMTCLCDEPTCRGEKCYREVML